MQPIATHGVAWSVDQTLCLSVGLSVTVISPAKMVEPIEMLFGIWTWVDPRNYSLDGWVQMPPLEGALLDGVTIFHMLLSSIPIGQLQMQLSVTLNFPSEKIPHAMWPLVKFL